MRKVFGFIFLFFLMACEGEMLPKPKAFLDLSYEKATYEKLSLQRPYTFFVSNTSTIKDEPNNWLKIQYPTLKASINITYRPIKNNIRELIQESEKLVVKHTVKADKISSQVFTDDKKRVFGTLHEISGDAASQIQFHVTDSSHHFIKGALYFNVKPNYDSILPAVTYLKKDIMKLIETIKWED